MAESQSGAVVSTQPKTAKASQRRRKLNKHLIAYSFLIPIFVSMGLFKYYPFYTAILKSFYQWNGANINKFIGLNNFVQLLSDPTFYVSLKNVTILTISFVLIQLTLPLYAAVGVFHSNKKLQNGYRVLFLVPMVVPYIIIFLLWRWIYMSNGMLNVLLKSIGLESWTHAWLGESATALGSILFVNFPWIGGIYFLIYLAGLITISPELFEVGRMDGMNAWQRFLHIELPLIRNQIRLVVILAFIHQYQSFENILVLTNGGPGFTTLTPALYLYKKGFEYNELGYASAIGVLIFAILVLFTLAANKLIKPTEKLD
ncbi:MULTISPECIES: carbohydrate ABC transporter permease [Paenibacillus]|uniref:Sugar ABC transporter permease n=1 Tax=Paenibacillus radicis (ex Xue et al. 2023) TaxID=2972489 RepID=A0ABT1YMF3_9BACL|nr:sugar ABC transporter permease [Paenibacillus radicis (ex Xue et al. 2023)]MCR8634227.1 sugar ABC transporter permease [Paenibacillus radicis (ex Xue et al. 2023)]